MAVLTAFEPKTEGQTLLHAETLAGYNRATLARRLRVDAVHTGLPGVMWAVIIFGAVISISASLFFRVEDARLHGRVLPASTLKPPDLLQIIRRGRAERTTERPGHVGPSRTAQH